MVNKNSSDYLGVYLFLTVYPSIIIPKKLIIAPRKNLVEASGTIAKITIPIIISTIPIIAVINSLLSIISSYTDKYYHKSINIFGGIN